MAPSPAQVCVLAIARLTLLTLVGFASTTAQYRFDSWTTDNGLPQNSIYSIIQTRDGYLWIATFDGLVRFDGVQFKVFNKSNTKGLSTNRFTALYEDKDGTLWAGTSDGGLTRYRDGVFTSSTVADGVPEGPVLFFSRDLKGELIIGIGSGRFYVREGKFISAPPEYLVPLLKENYLAPSGSQWTIEANEAVQINNGRMTRYRIKLKDTFYSRPYEDSERNLWLGEVSAIYKLRDGQVTRYSQKEGVPARGALRAYCEDDQGGVWFAGDGAVARFKDGRFTLYGNDRELAGLSITCLFKDREGTIWIGTSGGLFRLAKQFISGLSTESGLLHREVYPVLQSRNGDIWVGSILGLSRFRNGVFHNTPLLAPTNVVQALNEDRTGRLWIGIVDGLLLYENGKLKTLWSQIAGTTVCTILTDRNGDVWVGSERGLYRFKEEKVVAHYTTKEGLPSDDVRVIHEDRQGTLWIGTSGSLTRFEDGKFVSYPMPDGATRSHIRCIYEDADGTFWIGTYDDGLIRFRDGRFVNYRVDHGLFDNGVFHISEDRHGRFWISCNRGIYRVNRHELNDVADGKISRINSVAYGKRDGMLNIECNGGREPAGIVTRDGKFWFPTQEGVAVVDPENVHVNPEPPPVLIESITLERNPVDFQNGITIQPGQRGLEINYTGLSFIKADQTRFKYKLEGLDTDWIDAGTRRVAYFPYLPPGSYTFQVIAANSDGVWNRTGASVNVIVRAPFWRRWWFWLVCSIAVISIAGIVIGSRLTQLKRKHLEREAFSRRLIESQEAERKRLAGELHDSLAQILMIVKNWALIGLNSIAEDNPAREHLTEISENASLAIEEVREISRNLRPRQLEMIGLTNTIEQMVRHIRSSTDIEFITETDNIDGLLSRESEINLYRVLQ
ncbi:MAG TPA: two-component regulator propeller domain-containing protein, partial [Pyrinomonadaceae bacterium]|nr:two-component regulator propeller domain-containing protein [Pyrinomonadaceae bacterium]